jgi:hypothetical protein
MVLTGLRGKDRAHRMLAANGVIAPSAAWEDAASCPAFESLDEAILWCENHFKEVRRCMHACTRLGGTLPHCPAGHERASPAHLLTSKRACACMHGPRACRWRC